MRSSLPHSIDLVDAVAQLWLDQAKSLAEAEQWDDALDSAHMAARTRSLQNRTLAWPSLENFLREASQQLVGKDSDLTPLPKTRVSDPLAPKVCLHVLSEALPAGGLTAMAQRWMAWDDEHPIQEVVLLDSSLGVPHELARQVDSCQGRVHCPDPAWGPVRRAQWLRHLAHQRAHLVVLHVDTADVICAVAFGCEGGPPVMLVNHTAHSFWVGVSTCDLVINCRGSSLEMDWTRRHRGAAHQVCVPIPLPQTLPENLPETQGDQRQRARAAWGLTDDQVVMLAVGSAFKFDATPDSDFVATFERVLTQCPKAVLMVAGFEGDTRWQLAQAHTQGRLRTLGPLPQSALRQLHAASDLYVEGFPFGTTTALLEAAAAGLPVLLPPQSCPPPFATDGLAIDGLVQRDASWQDYETHCKHLLQDPSLRTAQSARLRTQVLEHHTCAGWRAHLHHALQSLPARHRIHQGFLVQPVSEDMVDYWERCKAPWSAKASGVLERSLLWALSANTPLPEGTALNTLCLRHAQARSSGALPASWVWVWRVLLTPWMPAAGSMWLLRLAMWSQKSRSGRSKPQGAYEEYRRWAQRSNLKWDAS